MMLNYYAEFERVVEAHNSEKIMLMLHPDYVKEQHDEFLEGRTEQFIREFFSCPLDNIKRLDYIVTYQWLGSQWVDFWIIQKDGTRNRGSWTILDRKDDSPFHIGLVGAVG